MNEPLHSDSHKAGLPPGSLVHVGHVLEAKTTISVVDYSDAHIEERPIDNLDELIPYRDSDSVTWIIVEGLSDIDIIEDIGEMFNIHTLVLEDIVNTHQRPKFEDYDDYLYIVLKSLLPKEEAFAVVYEQISLLIFDNIVITFKEKNDDLFHPVLRRIKSSQGRLRNLGSDYLTYAILDTIVDQCFVLIDSLDDAFTSLEDHLLTSEPTQETLNTIQHLKREIIIIRRYISPIRELMAGIIRSDSGLIHDKTYIYLRDVSDHAIRVTESVESYRDILSGLLDIYLSSVNNKMNEIMKVLTVFASIFIPLTFLAGIYGMNFKYMPELQWRWAYPAIWVAFLAISIGLLTYFKRKKWL